jgi:hypothetical protein
MSEDTPAELPKADRPRKGAGCFLFVIILVALIGGLVGWYGQAYPTYTYRFRMTVEVDVGGEIRSGSSIIEVRNSKQPQFLPEVGPVAAAARGDAVYVDLGQGRNVVATLTFGATGERPRFETLVPKVFRIAMDDAGLKRLGELRGSRELTGEDIPTLVSFADPNDPNSVRVVGVNEFDQVFGPGVQFKRVYIEMTTDPLTRGIERRLPWVTQMKAQGLGRSYTWHTGRFTINLPYFSKE